MQIVLIWQVDHNGTVAYIDQSNGWSLTQSGAVTVPSSAVSQQYTANYTICNGDGTISGSFYKFEVVCMTAEVDATETDRNETTYKLSCTAQISGGTAPYTYNWSGTVGNILSGQGTSSIEVEISVDDVGSIAVAVVDDNTPPCSAGASFSLCNHVTCQFTTALISTPPVGQTGPYIYECNSTSFSAFGSVQHDWSPSPVWTSADGTVARFSFPDDDEHTISLTVSDTNDCRAFKKQKVGGYEFTLSTDSSAEGTGTVTGTRDTMQFNVVLEAKPTGNFVGPPPAQLIFEFFRPATNSQGTATGTLVPGSSPPLYEFGWNVTQAKGRWQIKVQGYRSNTASFKIKKREQIVAVANSWAGAAQFGFDATPPQPPGYHGGNLCDDLARYFYMYVGLTTGGGGNDVEGLYASMNTATQDTQKGAIAFYHFPNDPNTEWRHNAINVAGGQIVDQNCGLSHQTDPPIPLIGSHSDIDPSLVNPSKYSAPSYHSTTKPRQRVRFLCLSGRRHLA